MLNGEDPEKFILIVEDETAFECVLILLQSGDVRIRKNLHRRVLNMLRNLQIDFDFALTPVHHIIGKRLFVSEEESSESESSGNESMGLDQESLEDVTATPMLSPAASSASIELCDLESEPIKKNVKSNDDSGCASGAKKLLSQTVFEARGNVRMQAKSLMMKSHQMKRPAAVMKKEKSLAKKPVSVKDISSMSNDASTASKGASSSSNNQSIESKYPTRIRRRSTFYQAPNQFNV